MKKTRTATLILALVISVLFLAAGIASAGGNPPNPGDEKTSGPAVRGSIELTPQTEGDNFSPVLFSFYGSCKGQDIIVEDQLLDGITLYSDVDEYNLIYYRINAESFLPNKCVPKDANTELIISKVRNYEDLGNMKVADVTLFFIGPK
jgi:hypothetical protein